MKKLGGRCKKESTGFTIVETMIVLAVSASLLIVAMVYINGRQTRTEFHVALRDTQANIQQALTEAANGYYQLGGNIKCDPPSGPSTPDPKLEIKSAGSLKRGENTGCIYIGNVLVFTKETIQIIPIAGQKWRDNKKGEDVSSLVEAKPTAIASDGDFNNNGPTDTIKHIPLHSGLKFRKASYNNSSLPATTLDTFGFASLSSLADFITVDSTTSGVQTMNLYQTNGLTGSTDKNIAKSFNSLNNNLPLAQKVNLCFESIGLNQSVLITVGGQGSQTVTTQIKTGKDC